MAGIEQLQEGLQSSFGGVVTDVREFITEKPIQTAILGAGIIGVGVTAGILAAKSKRPSRKKRKKKRKTTRKGRSRDRKFRSKQKHELAYVRRKRKAGKKITRPRYKTKKSRRGIHYTKKGQPYIILRSGKARFIKKRKGRR